MNECSRYFEMLFWALGEMYIEVFCRSVPLKSVIGMISLINLLILDDTAA